MDFFQNTQRGAGSPPLFKMKGGERQRIRILYLPGTKYENAEKFWIHSPPHAQKQNFGGFCTVKCIGKMHCIFHNGEYDWPAKVVVPINIVHYETNPSLQWTGKKEIKLWEMGTRAHDALSERIKMMGPGFNLFSRDIIISRVGDDTNTVYMFDFVDPCEQEFSWDYPPQNEAFRDDQYAFLIDCHKLRGYKDMTVEEQYAFLNERIQYGQRGGQASPEAPGQFPSALTPPSGLFGAPAASPFSAQPLPQYAFAAPTAPPSMGAIMNGDMMGRPAKLPPIEEILSIADPWGHGHTLGSMPIENLTFIINTDGFSAEQKRHAKAAHDHRTKPAVPAAPPAPPMPPVAAAPVPPAPAVAQPLPVAYAQPDTSQFPSLPPAMGGPVPIHQAAAAPMPTAPLPSGPVATLPSPPAAAPKSAHELLTEKVVNLLKQRPIFGNDNEFTFKMLKKVGIEGFHQANEAHLNFILEQVLPHSDETLRVWVG